MFLSHCLLFTPANRPDRFKKAKELHANGVIIDLEDAISLDEKDSARKQAISYLQGRSNSPLYIVCLRINSIRTKAGLKDLSALCDANVRPDMLVLPKSESAHEIEIINEILSPNTIPIIPLLMLRT